MRFQRRYKKEKSRLRAFYLRLFSFGFLGLYRVLLIIQSVPCFFIGSFSKIGGGMGGSFQKRTSAHTPFGF
jgi:hypothetical protein